MAKQEDTRPNVDALMNFSQLLCHLEEGELHTEATQIYQDVVRDLNAALITDRKASAVITVTVKLTADRGVIEAVSDVKAKYPPRPRGRSMMYVAGGALLSGSNPNQYSLPLRTVPAAEQEIRTAN